MSTSESSPATGRPWTPVYDAQSAAEAYITFEMEAIDRHIRHDWPGWSTERRLEFCREVLAAVRRWEPLPVSEATGDCIATWRRAALDGLGDTPRPALRLVVA